MDEWAIIATITKDWALPLVAAVIGAVAGGATTWHVARAESRRARRERYGQALLDALGSARLAVEAARTRAYASARATELVQAPVGGEAAHTGLTLPREARDIWVNAQLAATLERSRDAKSALSGWALHHHESLLGGAYRIEDFDWLAEQLQLGEYIVVAWLSGDAPGTDFTLEKTALAAKYSPQYRDSDLPEYGRPAPSIEFRH